MSKVVVLLPVYKKDHPDYLSLAVNSILNQTFSDFELLIGVDGYIEDKLNNILKEFESNSNIEIIRFKENRGLAIVLNDLLDIAKNRGADYIARMDADDISVNSRFEKQVQFLETHMDIDVVGGAIFEIDENGNSRNKTIVYPATPSECKKFFSRRNPHAHPAVMFRWSFFNKVGHGYRPEYRQNQDTMLWLDGMMAGTMHANIPDVILNFRMTDSLFKKRRNGWKFAKKQLKDRLLINRSLGYGVGANVFGFMMFLLLVSPTWVRKAAYKIFR